MADTTNIFGKTLIDLDGLGAFWGKVKEHISGEDVKLANRITALEGLVGSGESVDSKLASLKTELTSAIDTAKGEAISEATTTAAGDATLKANKAKEDAISTFTETLKSYYDKTSVDGLITGANTYADRKAADAQAAAEATAAGDATLKANKAKEEAVTEAATNVTNTLNNYYDKTNVDGLITEANSYADGKASDAQAAAEVTAAGDATLKANKAKEEAISAFTETLKSYYDKTSVDGFIAGAKTYAEGKATAAKEAAESTAATALSNHVDAPGLHTTSELQAKWNKAASDIDAFLSGAVSDKEEVIDTLKEIQSILGQEGGNTIAQLMTSISANSTAIGNLTTAFENHTIAIDAHTNRFTNYYTKSEIDDIYIATTSEIEGLFTPKA